MFILDEGQKRLHKRGLGTVFVNSRDCLFRSTARWSLHFKSSKWMRNKQTKREKTVVPHHTIVGPQLRNAGLEMSHRKRVQASGKKQRRQMWFNEWPSILSAQNGNSARERNLMLSAWNGHSFQLGRPPINSIQFCWKQQTGVARTFICSVWLIWEFWCEKKRIKSTLITSKMSNTMINGTVFVGVCKHCQSVVRWFIAEHGKREYDSVIKEMIGGFFGLKIFWWNLKAQLHESIALYGLFEHLPIFDYLPLINKPKTSRR